MARNVARPGRTLVIFFLGVAITYGLVAIGGTWKPELGLDLQGGTRITLTANGSPSTESLDEARQIIDQRVNGSGVAEAEVTTQSGRYIVVEIPGASRRDLVDTVERQAQLRFRLVACSDFTGCGTTTADQGAGTVDPTVPDTTEPGAGVTVAPSASADPSAGASASGDASPAVPSSSPSAGGSNNRPPVGFSDTTSSPTAAPSATPSPTDAPTADPSASGSASGSGSAPAVPTETAAGTTPVPAPDGGPDVADPLTWMNNPNQEAIDAFNAFTCPTDGSAANVVDDPDKPLVTCEVQEDGTSIKYLLSAAAIEGTDLDSASAGIPNGQVQWVVNLSIGGEGQTEFTKISRALAGSQQQFAIVLDGQVISAPTMDAVITDGNAQISGNFTQATSESLATSLKFGALPIAFEKNPTTELIGPSLAGNQLQAGITAGLIGLLLVMLYCLLYYRGLGLVVLSSLVVAAAITYSMVLLLSQAANFTLTLPGIAGLIIAVGVTADSFIIFFERIRDEMREGKSMRVAVESGWKRAKVTRLAANVVSLLSASVLYIFATGVVKGFGFALGLSTLIDLAVLFWFTKPLVSVLARYKFFNSGHKLSGLSAGTLGMDQAPAPKKKTPVAAGGNA